MVVQQMLSLKYLQTTKHLFDYSYPKQLVSISSCTINYTLNQNTTIHKFIYKKDSQWGATFKSTFGLIKVACKMA